MARTDHPAEPPAGGPAGKGLQSGALGLWGNTVIGLGATAPVYSLAATLGYVVLAVHDKAPAMFLLAFVPMLLVAVAYRELNRAAPDCGTTFTWGTKAFGPWVGWMGGWGVAVSAIIVLANVAEISAVYTLRFLGLDAAADSLLLRTALGLVFIVGMTWVSYRGITISERIQNALVIVQFAVLAIVSVGALWLVYSGGAGSQAVRPSWDWFSPFGVSGSAMAEAVILCIFIYWGWDACLAVSEETRDSDRTPGRAALLATVILVVTYVLVAVAVQAYAGFGTTGIGLNNPDNADDVLSTLGHPVGGAVMSGLLLITVAISAASSTQTTILPTARGTLSMAVYGALPRRFANVHPRYKTPSFGTVVMGAAAVAFYVVLSLVSQNALQDSIASLGLAVAFYYGITAFSCIWYFRRTLTRSARDLLLRGVLPALGGLAMLWAFVQSCVDMLKPDYGFTTFGPLGGVFVIGIGMLVLGVPLMLLCATRLRPFFTGRTLDADTPILVPETGAPPIGGL
ncbi:APC family permease [Kineococcus rhizosphaerae]|uniref:Amino acid/polyamine/organocation transporter (APC superfamily) n=1 Tax=Kineococcus rhizosphaerae TaxID=559628 RepID=A0A2T0R207_9ACTN|nr:APC family permease [Kineococcus rhizosphaerae]PRY13543.1 amino acid/polyamine/organocation transporter (APC superfamily) [Kineococcus rhizosphaerae]